LAYELGRNRHDPREPERTLAADEQARLREALLDLCAERGYESISLADLLARADLSERRFLGAYADLEDYLCAVFVEILGKDFGELEEVLCRESGWRERWRAAAFFVTRSFARDPRLAHLIVVDLQSAGERPRRLYEETATRLFDLVEAGGDGPAEPPVSRATLEAIGGAISTHIYLSLSRGEDFREDLMPRLEKLPFPTWEDTPITGPEFTPAKP
jgi:AcrR family transcriptional regulator